jgi:hypothetical protein
MIGKKLSKTMEWIHVRPTEVLALKFCTQCPSRYFALHLLRRNSVHKVAIVSDKKISRNESIAQDVRTVENPSANEAAYHITNQEEDELFRLKSCPCDLQNSSA